MSDEPRIGFRNGNAVSHPPHRDVYERLDVQDRMLEDLQRTVGRFPDINGHNGAGICLYLHELRDERRAKTAFWGRVVKIGAVVTFFLGTFAGFMKVATDLHWLK